jgi:carbamoyl-phosphate synthase large subunit
VVPRHRIETRDGEISKGRTVKNSAIISEGRRLAEALPGAFGAITAQCFVTAQGEIRFIEINPRFGGGFPLSAAAGADFPGWLIRLATGEDPDIAIDGWRDGVTMLRYDEAFFLDGL